MPESDLRSLEREARDVCNIQVESCLGQQHTGRFAVLDDLGLFGLDRALTLLKEEGALGLFAHTHQDVARFVEAARSHGLAPHAHTWDFYLARREALTFNHDGSEHLQLFPRLDIGIHADWGEELTQSARELMRSCGIAPASVQTLRGRAVRNMLALARDASGEVVATGAITWGHSKSTPWTGHAQIGMACVSDSVRGRGLGRRLTATLLSHLAHDDETLGVTAACSSDNLASAALLRASGFHRQEDRSCVMFALDGTRRTR